jgi:hypothetical protein
VEPAFTACEHISGTTDIVLLEHLQDCLNVFVVGFGVAF